MNPLFRRRRDRLLTYQAMREKKLTGTGGVPCPSCGGESSQAD